MAAMTDWASDEAHVRNVVSEIVTQAAASKTFIQKHERFLLGMVFAFCTMFSVYKVEQHMDSVQAGKVQQLQTQLEDQKAIDAANSKQTAQVEAQYAAMVDALSKQNAALATSVTARNIALQKQQTADQSLPPTELALRWQNLIGGTSGDILATGNGFAVSGSAGVGTVTALEAVPVLQQNLAAETQIVENEKKELDSANRVVATLNNQVSGLKTELADQIKADQAQISEIKKKARVSKLRWFGIGVGAGMATVLRFVF